MLAGQVKIWLEQPGPKKEAYYWALLWVLEVYRELTQACGFIYLIKLPIR